MAKSEKMRKRKLFWYSAAAFLMAFGRAGSLKFYETERVDLSGNLKAVFFLMRLLLYFIVFSGIFAGIEKLISSKKFTDVMFEKGEALSGKWWRGYVIFALGWLSLLLIKYPAALCWDTWAMISDYMRHTLREHHSVFYTLIMGKSIDFGIKFGHSNWGLFLFSALHYLLLAAVFGYALQFLRKMKISRPVRAAVMIGYLLNPYIIDYVGVIIKDIPYAACLVIVHICLMDAYLDHEAFSGSLMRNAILFISAAVVCLVRKNGIYVTGAAAVFFLVRCLRRKLSKRSAVVLICACIFSTAVSSWLGSHYNAEKGSIREALSVPFQQTARYVRDYGNEVTEEEKEAIDAVLNYDSLAKLYHPHLSDWVKTFYKEDNTKLPAYFKTWFAQFLKHPMCYVNATWEQNYYLFVPEIDNIVIYQDINIGYETGTKIDVREKWFYMDIFRLKEPFSSFQQWIVQVLDRIHQMPVIGLLGNVSFWFYVLLIVTAVCLAHGTGSGLIVWFLYFSVAFVVLGPAIQGHPRYMFPVIYPMPVMICFILYRIKNKFIQI